MIYRLRFCNKEGIEARVDIQKGSSTPVIEVEGTDRPFILSYNNDKGNKSGMFLTSSADIEIYETTDFNIDNLKTSNETELSVTHYINNVISWQGFIIPDFFSIEVRSNPIIVMTASDRLGTLKNVTLSDLPSMISLRELAILCLNKTGLTLPLKTMADFSNGTGVNDFFNSKILTQRLSDTKGRNISCYDVLSSILTASNSFLTQRSGEWYIVNKYQHEIGSGKLYDTATTSTNWSEVIHDFSEITVGGRRTIIPVGSSVGVYQEFGGGKLYPENYDFSEDLLGWTPVGGFGASINNKEIKGYYQTYNLEYGEVTDKKYLVNSNNYSNTSYIQTADIPVPYTQGEVEVSVDMNVVGPRVAFGGNKAPIRIAIVAKKGASTYYLNKAGSFTSTSPYIHEFLFGDDEQYPLDQYYKPLTMNVKVSGRILSPVGYTFQLRIYGSNVGPDGNITRVTTVNFARLNFGISTDIPKGIIYKSEQGSDFTKTHDLETSIFGDYLTNGLNGYFYDYPKDDTSSLFNNAGVLTNNWTTPTDTEELPLLQHISRQKARMFSVAHDLLTAEIEVVNFDPLAIFRDCDGKRYSIVTAEVDFFNAKVNLDIEQIIYDGTILRRDFVYSYFGDGEKGIKGIGGISGGTGGGGVDLGIIGGINDRIDEVGQKMDDIKVGVSNLLRNTGFLGDFNSLEVDALTAVLENTQIGTNPLVHWVHVNAEVIDAPSISGKGVRIGSLQQNVDLRAGEAYVLSFMAKGASLTVNLVDDIEVELTDEFKKYSFDIVAPNTGSFIFWITDPSLSSEVYEIMLSEGNTDVDYAYAAEDDLKAIAQLQAINAITSVIKDYDTDILGGLILTSMIQLGKYKNGVMEEVNAGISGIYNNDDDPAAWFGGSLEKAIRTVQRIKSNPYSVSEEEWADMANIVFTHGGDGFFKGIIYALGGIFRGRIESNAAGNRIIINPEQRAIELRDDNNDLRGRIFFMDGGWGAYQLYEYYESGSLKKSISVDSLQGIIFRWYDDNDPIAIKSIEYRAEGNIYNGELPDMTDEAASAALALGQWYRTGRIVKINI